MEGVRSDDDAETHGVDGSLGDGDGAFQPVGLSCSHGYRLPVLVYRQHLVALGGCGNCVAVEVE